MAKKIEYNKDTKVFSLINKMFSSYTKDELNEFKELKKDLEELSPEEYVGRYSKLLFKNQAKTYFLFYPPKSGGGSPHIELYVHPDSSFNFMEVFDPYKYEGSLRVQLADKRKFRKLNISHKDYDLLATFFCMEIQNKNVLKISNTEVQIEDKKMTFDKIIDTLNNFDDRFFLNDLKRLFPFDDLTTYYISKVGNDCIFTVKFLKNTIRISFIVNKKPKMVMELNSNGKIDLMIDEDDLQKVIGNEKNYTDLFDRIFKSGRNGFNKLTIEFISGSIKNSPLKDTYKEYRIDGEPLNVFMIR